MGYIFDALNKQNGDAPEEPTPQDEVREEALSIHAETDNSDVALNDASADLDDAAPFRLADVKLSLNTDEFGQTVVGSDQDTGPAITIGAERDNPFDDEPTVNDDDETADLSVDEPLKLITTTKKAGWWSRLMGRHLRGKVDDRLVAMTSPASSMSEEYRSIRTSILARHDNERHLVHTITSATPQEGKTITCVNLGLAFAELRNRKTIIIECDLRLPTFGKLLNCDANRVGLIDYLRGDAKVADIIQQVEGSSLHIITAGGRVSDEAVQLLSSQRMSNLIQGLRAKYDHVIIDTPPVLQLADAGILGSQSEEVLVVARMRRTPRPLVEQAINTLTSYNAQVNGIIATDNPRSRGRGYGYKYGYRYGYAYGYTPDRKGRKSRNRDAA
jgi:capsular exopolysaccharide synthesis family protein